MNFYKHHLGDYAAATLHLTWDEDCAYRRLIDQYYKRESPLPAEIKDACRLARATTPAQRRSVEKVLQEFFVLLDDGWHQKRCDEEIASATAQAYTNRRIAEDREAKRRKRTEHESFNESFTTNQVERADFVNLARLQTPDSISQTPVTRHHQGGLQPTRTPPLAAGVADAPPVATPKPPRKPKAELPTNAETWHAYSEAYSHRYGTSPVRNAKVNAQISQLVARLGADESPPVAAFFLTHQNALYVRAMHPTDLLLRDAEKLRTEWATNRTITNTQAIQADRTQTNANAFAPLIAEAREMEKHAIN